MYRCWVTLVMARLLLGTCGNSSFRSGAGLQLPACPATLCQLCLASSPQVKCRKSGPAILGEDVTLTCEFLAPMDVLQVTWQKKKADQRQNMVTHSEKYGVKITPQFEKFVSVSRADSATSAITISKLEKEDEACYVCLFNVHPNGAYTGEVCLPQLGPVNEVLCFALGTYLHVDLDPRKIQTRHSIAVTELRQKHLSMRGGQYTTNINPTCAFQIPRDGRRRRNAVESPNSWKGANKAIVIECTAFGIEKPEITWHNEGHPISQEDKINRTGGVITVTSTRQYNASLFPAGVTFCNITHGPQSGPHPAKYPAHMETESGGNPNRGLAEEPSLYSEAWRVPLVAVAALLAVGLLIFTVIWRKTSRKEVENGSPKCGKTEVNQSSPHARLKDSAEETGPVTPKCPSFLQNEIEATPPNRIQIHSGVNSSAKTRRNSLPPPGEEKDSIPAD